MFTKRDRMEDRARNFTRSIVIFSHDGPRSAQHHRLFPLTGMSAETATIGFDLAGVAVSVSRGVFLGQGSTLARS